jgi:hypothetical protein
MRPSAPVDRVISQLDDAGDDRPVGGVRASQSPFEQAYTATRVGESREPDSNIRPAPVKI